MQLSASPSCGRIMQRCTSQSHGIGHSQTLDYTQTRAFWDPHTSDLTTSRCAWWIGRGEGICRFPAVPLDFQVK